MSEKSEEARLKAVREKFPEGSVVIVSELFETVNDKGEWKAVVTGHHFQEKDAEGQVKVADSAVGTRVSVSASPIGYSRSFAEENGFNCAASVQPEFLKSVEEEDV